MKTLITVLAFTTTLVLHAQITEGQIIYRTRTENTEKTSSDDATGTNQLSESAFTVDFNKKYIRSDVREEGVSTYSIIQNKINGETYTSLTDESNKTIHFIDDATFIHSVTSDLEDTTIILTDETKYILDFFCKKSIMQTGHQKLTIWTTDQIGGLELLHHFPKLITGTPLEISSEEGGYLTSTTATFFNVQTTLTNDLSLVPEGYTLDLGNIGFNAYDAEKYSFEPFFSIPDFITVDHYQEFVKSINRETYNLIYPKPLEKYTFPFLLFYISIDEKGKIKSIEFGSSASSLVNVDKLRANIMKNCYFKQPISIEGKAYPSVLTISYNYKK